MSLTPLAVAPDSLYCTGRHQLNISAYLLALTARWSSLTGRHGPSMHVPVGSGENVPMRALGRRVIFKAGPQSLDVTKRSDVRFCECRTTPALWQANYTRSQDRQAAADG